MKRTRLSPVSKKTAKRLDECRDFRRELVAWVRHCEICGHDPERVERGGVRWMLCCHEIARGPLRLKALDQRYALLILCYRCHMARVHGDELWLEARQLAVLKKSRPEDYDLAAYNKLVGYGPKRITEADVGKWA